MIIKNITEKEMKQALKSLNKRFKGNVIFKRLDNLGKRFRFTLRVKDSKGPGAGHGPCGRRSVSACWHVHGLYFEEVFKIRPDAVITSRGQKITEKHGNWQDCNIGSIIRPLPASWACECRDYSDRLPEFLRA